MKKNLLLSSAAIVALLASCNDSKFEGFTKAENGLHYKFFNRDEAGRKVQEGDGILLRYIISSQKNDSVIIDSKNVSRDGSGYAQFGMQKTSFVGSLEDGMMMMAKGDSAEFIVSADSFFLKSMKYNELPKGFKQGEFVKAIFKIKDVITKSEMEANQKKQQAEQEAQSKQQEALMRELEPKEKPALEKYLKDNKINVKPTASGLIYMEVKKGTGENPKATDIVKVNYTGRLLDGTIFDSSEGKQPIEFPLNQVIPGWTEGLQLMKKGGKAKLILPSSIAYGPKGGGPIPPYSALAFDVELLDFKAAPEQPAAPPQQNGQ